MTRWSSSVAVCALALACGVTTLTSARAEAQSCRSEAYPRSISLATWAPEGSTFTDVGNGRLVVQPPAGYYVLPLDGTSTGDSRFVTAGATVTCSCSKGSSGCTAVTCKAGTCCLSGDCTTCDRSSSGIAVGGLEVAFAKGDGSDAGLPTADLGQLSMVREIRESLDHFQKSLYPGRTTPPTVRGPSSTAKPHWVYAPVTVYGFRAAMLLPLEVIPDDVLPFVGSTATCDNGGDARGCTRATFGSLTACQAGTSFDCSITIVP